MSLDEGPAIPSAIPERASAAALAAPSAGPVEVPGRLLERMGRIRGDGCHRLHLLHPKHVWAKLL